MSFCPRCGVQNTDDARFCNKCGAAIGAAGASAGPASASGPAPTNTSGSITLAGIGIQSPSRTYAVLAVGALAFLALGAGLAYFGMHSGGGAPTASADTTGGGGDSSGDALPAGVDVPDGDFVMTSGARVVKRGASASTDGTAPPTTTTSAAHTDTTGTTAATGTGTTGRVTPPPHTTVTTHTTGSTTPPTHTTGTTTPPDPTDPPPTTTPTTGSGSGTPPASSVDWDAMGQTIDPDSSPDYQMQMYSTQVRRFIRQYLLPRATSCFEHASAIQRDPVRGTVAIGFDIDARGHAQGATIDRNTTGVDPLATCLRNEVNGWQLPPPPEGTAPIQMQMPFTR